MLGDLRAAIAAGDWVNGVELALAAWRDTRAPALADIIDLVGARCPAPALEGTLHPQWMTRALPYNPSAVSQLLDNVYVGVDGVAWDAMRTRLDLDNPLMSPVLAALAGNPLREDFGLFDRLAAIHAWPDDPRMAGFLADFIITAPLAHNGTTTAIALRVAGERFAVLGDTRSLERLRTCVREPRGRSSKVRASQVLGAMAAVDHLRPIPPISSELTAAIAACRALLGPAPVPRASGEAARPELDALWAAVAADPTDLTARLVLGDALVELGDSRGQLIAMQCNQQSGALRGDDRPRALIRRDWRKWLGDLALVIVRGGSEWRNGMLECVNIGKHDGPAWAYSKSRGHREMCAVTTVIGTNCPAHGLAVFVLGLPRDPRRIALRDDDSLRELTAVGATYGFRALTFKCYSSRPEETFQQIARAMPLLEEIELDASTYALPTIALAVPQLPAMIPGLTKIRLTRIAVESTRGESSIYAWLRESPLVEIVE